MGEAMINTGTFANPTEIEELKDLLHRLRTTPVLALSSHHALEHGGFSGEARKAMVERCHEIALSHGLPEITGFYGCDLATGEFVRTE